MKHFTLKLFLLIACLCGATSVWAQTTTVGTTDNQTGWWSAFSDDYSIGADQTLSLSFVNHSDKAAVYHNWLLVLTTDSHRGDTGYEEYFVLRPDNLDNCGWGGAWNKTNLWSSYAGISDDDFLNAMDGANVNLTVTRSGANVSIQVEMTAVDGSKYNRTYGAVCGDGTQTIRAFLSVEKAHITDLTASTAATVLPTTISSLPFYTGFNAGVNPFNAGSITTTGNIGNALHVNNATATATWGDGTNPYTLADNEEVTVSFTAFHGWASKLSSSVSIVNADNEELVSYTIYESNVTDVKIGGEKVNTSNFRSQSGCPTNGRNANGLTANNQQFQPGTYYNPVVTMTIRKSGNITFSFVLEEAGINQTFTGNVGEKAATIKYLNVYNNNSTDDRAINIDNLNITSVISTTPQHTYSIIWKNQSDNSTIKEETGLLGDVNTTPVISQESFFYNEKKYDYVSDNAAPLTTDDTEIIVVCKEADKCAYTINAVKSDDHTQIIKQITTGTVYAGESVVVPYPKYVLSGGTLFEKGVNNKEYRQTVTISSENPTVAFPYTATTITDVVYFSEGEEIEGATYTNAGVNMNARSSKAACGYVSEDIVITNLPAGLYKATMVCYSNSSAGATQKFAFGDTEFEASIKGASNWSQITSEFALSEASDIKWLNSDSGNKNGLDFIYIQRTGDFTISKTISAAGYATLYSDKALDFTNVEGLKAYIITAANGDKLTTQKVTKIPANTGVLLEGEAGTYDIPVAASAEPVEGNRFEGVLEATEKEAGIFVLMNSTAGVGFYKTSNTFTVGAGTAYLPADIVPAEVKALRINQEGTTAIQGIDSEVNEANAEIYNLAGQRVAAPTKGIYVINGKKVMVK